MDKFLIEFYVNGKNSAEFAVLFVTQSVKQISYQQDDPGSTPAQREVYKVKINVHSKK